MTRERRDYPLGRISICSTFIHVVRLKHFRDVSSGTVGIEWCFDLHKTVENRGTVVAVCYGRREAVGRTAGWVTERVVTDARLWHTALYATIPRDPHTLPPPPPLPTHPQMSSRNSVSHSAEAAARSSAIASSMMDWSSVGLGVVEGALMTSTSPSL